MSKQKRILKNLKTNIVGYKDRKKRKIFFRKLWIHRINAATRLTKLPYNVFMELCKQLKLQLNRKILSQLIIYDNQFFLALKDINGYDWPVFEPQPENEEEWPDADWGDNFETKK